MHFENKSTYQQLKQSISNFYMEILINQNIFIAFVKVHKILVWSIIFGMTNRSLLS